MEQQAKLIVQLTRDLGRQDGFTRWLNELNGMLTGVFAVPFIIIVPLTTTASGLLSVFSTGLWSIVIDVVYGILVFPLLLTSKLHQGVPVLTKVTFIPSLVLVIMVYLFVSLMGSQGRAEEQIVRLATIESWPNSVLVKRVVAELLVEDGTDA